MQVKSDLEAFGCVTMHGRGVANDGGKGPEMGDEGDVHCLQKGLILSQAKCLVL